MFSQWSIHRYVQRLKKVCCVGGKQYSIISFAMNESIKFKDMSKPCPSIISILFHKHCVCGTVLKTSYKTGSISEGSVLQNCLDCPFLSKIAQTNVHICLIFKGKL